MWHHLRVAPTMTCGKREEKEGKGHVAPSQKMNLGRRLQDLRHLILEFEYLNCCFF